MKRLVAGQFVLFATLALGAPSDSGPRGVERAAPPHLGGCTTSGCHDDLRDAPLAHRPVAEGVCRICHRQTGDDPHRFRLAREGSRLCRTCHHEIEAAANVHLDLWRGECTMCHDPHGTGHPFMLSAAHVSAACDECHAEVLDAPGATHLPVAGLRCTACHDPHGSSILPPAGDGESTCLGCHRAIRTRIESAPYVHEPVRAGACVQCHVGHDLGSDAGLRQDVPALCYGCHDDVRVAMETAKHGHTAASVPGGCLTCHDPHASSERFGLRSDPLTLCAECHDQEVTRRDGSTIAGVSHEIEVSAFLHGPVRQRDCSACHDSHGSVHAGLLVENYTPEFYAPFDLERYRLCFSCHPERGVLTARTTRLTEFRNGDLNLHYLHVNKPELGRTCRACHATHASDAPKHIRSWVQYGEWRLPIAFTKTDTGGQCRTGCHVERAYDRQVPVDYAPAAP